MTTRTATKHLSWTPVRRGDTYCADACGRGCTRKEYETAQDRARRLAHSLGPGWQPVVWENLGWHYKAVSPDGRIKIHCHGRTYTAFLGEAGHSGGRWAESGRTAKAALRAVLRRALSEQHEVNALVASAKKVAA